MNPRIAFLLICLLITGCTTAQPPAPTNTSLPEPTPIAVATRTSAPSPTVAPAPTQAPLPAGQEIIFDGSDNRNLTGTLYGEGETAILLANMSIGGQKQWNPLVAAVNPQKFTTVTFDYRTINDVSPDMQHILGWLRQEGFERIICIGASLGTQACSSIALEPEMAGIVLIAGSVHFGSVAEAVYPKLFIAGELDPGAFNIQTGYERAAEPKELVIFEDNRAHGTDLFSSTDSGKFLTLLLDFVDGLTIP